MRTATVEIYSDATNAAIVRVQGRKFPGVVIQGDTLNELVKVAQHISYSTSSTGEEELELDAKELAEQLTQLLEHYKLVLAEHNIELPFSPSNA